MRASSQTDSGTRKYLGVTRCRRASQAVWVLKTEKAVVYSGLPPRAEGPEGAVPEKRNIRRIVAQPILFLRTYPTKPSAAVPRSSNVPGSGTGLLRFWLPLSMYRSSR